MLPRAAVAELEHLGLTSLRRIALLALLPAYGVLYWLCYAFGWGGPEVHLAILDLAFVPIGLVAVAAAHIAARRAPSQGSRRAWTFIGLGFAAYAFGDLAWSWIEIVLGQEVPFPSIADVGYLAFFPLMVIGVGFLPRERRPDRLGSWLDMALVMVGAGVSVWWAVLEPVSAATAGSLGDIVLALAYPVGDTLVLFVLIAALLSRLTETDGVVLTLLALGLGLNVAGDLVYARLLLESDYASSAWPDLMFLLGWVAMSMAAAIQGTSRVQRSPPDGRVPIRPFAVLGFVAVSVVYIPLAASSFAGDGSDRVLVAGAVVVTALVVSRQIRTARQNAALIAAQVSARAAARFQALVRNASDVIMVIDRAGVISFATPSAEPIFGQEAGALEGRSITSLFEPAVAPMVGAVVDAAASRPGTSEPAEFAVAGTEQWVEMRLSNLLDNELVSGLVATIHDVTERKAFEQQLEAQAFHDPLTGLANRVLFADRVERATVRSRRSGRLPAILYLDVDDLRRINDTIGQQAGDDFLVEVARRISSTVRGEDTAARLGGDEFGILVDETRDIDEAVALANRLTAAFTPPFVANGSSFALTCSIGIARADRAESASPSAELLRNAEIAMYAAAARAHGSSEVFHAQMHASMVDRMKLEFDLALALEGGQLQVAYQPIVAVADGRIRGVEALLRWHHPERGVVMPGEFIPVAEASREIIRIGDWVLEETCRAVAGWNAVGSDRPLRANVNVSVVQLEPGFAVRVAAILARTRLPADNLVIEITESVFSDDRREVIEILGELRALGIRISIDDFGTGFSSLSRLRDLPIDELKIDRAFVNQLRGEVDSSFVSTIIHLARELSVGTVAEGVEDTEQLALLRELGCDLAQGYLIGKPTDAAGIKRFLSSEPAAELAPTAPLAASVG